MRTRMAAVAAFALVAFGPGPPAAAQVADASPLPRGDDPATQISATSGQTGNTAGEASATEGSESVTVTAEKRRPDYRLFRDLDSNNVCPTEFTRVALGFSCAEITYEVFDRNGKFLRRCNIPVFAVMEGEPFEYLAVTFRAFNCGNPKQKKRDLYAVDIKELLNPKTSDKTVFKQVSILGYQQAEALCEASKELCVLHLFDHRDQLTNKALKGEWDTGPPLPEWAREYLGSNDESEPYVSFGEDMESMFKREGER